MGILFGILLIIAGIILTFWNEGHGLHTAQSLVEAKQQLISVPTSPIDPKNNLKVVYFSGFANTKDILRDTLLGVSENAISLQRKVLMYQWKENKETKTESQLGGSEKQVTTYSYQKVWSSRLIDSSQFKQQPGHENPAALPVESEQQYAQTVKVGDFLLPEVLIREISEAKAVDLSKININNLQSRLNKPIKLINNQLYAGQDYQNPQVGDVRISLLVIPAQTVSIIAQQTGNSLQAYMAKAGQSVLLLASGQQSSDQMIENALTENRIITWILRGASLAMMILGFSLILKPIVVLADVLPILGSIAGFGTGVVAFLCGFSLWVLITAIAWFAIRPLWSLGLLLVAAIIIYFVYQRRKTKPIAPVQPIRKD